MANCGEWKGRGESKVRPNQGEEKFEAVAVFNDSHECYLKDGICEQKNLRRMWLIDLVSGGIAGAISRTITAPLDRIKFHYQLNKGSTTLVKSIDFIYKNGGLRAFWYGNAVNVIKIIPESGTKFAVYDQVKAMIKRNDHHRMQLHERFTAGAIAGAISQTMIYPIDVLRVRLTVRKPGQYSGAFDALAKIYKMEGIRSFYRGFLPNIIGIVPYAGIDLALYETLKKKYSRYVRKRDRLTGEYLPNLWVLITCGTISCTMGQAVAYPLNLMRTRMQVHDSAYHGADGPKPKLKSVLRNPALLRKRLLHRETMLGLLYDVLSNEGPRGLYRGLVPNFMKVVPSVAITYAVYEHVSRYLEHQIAK